MTIIEVTDPKVSYRTADSWLDAFTGTVTPIRWPTETNVGIDAIDGWEPVSVIDGTSGLDYLEPDGVIEDVQLTGGGSITVRAPRVTIRRCEVINGSIQNIYGDVNYNGLVVEDSTVRSSPQGTQLFFNKAIGDAGFTAKRCSIIDASEGFRTGGSVASGVTLADPALDQRVRIFDCYCRIALPIGCTPETDYHGDGIQAFDGGFGGVPLTVRNSSFFSIDDFGVCTGNSCLIVGVNQSQLLDIDGMLMEGTIIPFRTEVGGTMSNLYIVHNSWQPGFSPMSIDETTWGDIDAAAWSCWTCDLDVDGQVDTLVNSIPHGYPGFGPLDPP